MSIVVAIDGPAASGKGTLASRMAKELGFHHLDTGLLYRATAFRLLTDNTSLDDPESAGKAAASLSAEDLAEPSLSDHAIGEAASKIAVYQQVRQALFEYQTNFANQEPGAVLDGRDIASVICPDADVKLFVTATAEARADRRHKQAHAKDSAAKYEDILADIKKRDERDTNREVAPLMPDPNAHLIDTTNMDIETAFQEALSIVKQALV